MTELALSTDVLAAHLVYDGANVVVIPKECGEPRTTGDKPQMSGKVGENLCELAGRICYDSLGGVSTRGSAEYHKHILDVGHGSVYEHFNLTVGFNPEDAMTMPTAIMLLGRPGIHAYYGGPKQGWRVTLNARAVLEWNSWSERLPNHPFLRDTAEFVGEAIRHLFHEAMPLVIRKPLNPAVLPVTKLMAQTDDEKWITLYLAGSRGFSHEQVRHGDFSAISQRSTRYCQESESKWVEHPLITAYLADLDKRSPAPESLSEPDMVRAEQEYRDIEIVKKAHAKDPSIEVPAPSELLTALMVPVTARVFRNNASVTMDWANFTYEHGVANMEAWLIARGVDKGTARKQARGASRGFLGNALSTEMLFSASVSQWLRMFKQRGGQAADAEIREVYVKALPELQRSRYGKSFLHLILQDSPDGTGKCVVDMSTLK